MSRTFTSSLFSNAIYREQDGLELKSFIVTHYQLMQIILPGNNEIGTEKDFSFTDPTTLRIL